MNDIMSSLPKRTRLINKNTVSMNDLQSMFYNNTIQDEFPNNLNNQIRQLNPQQMIQQNIPQKRRGYRSLQELIKAAGFLY